MLSGNHPSDNSVPPGQAPAPGDAPGHAQHAAHLAHELANLLDGSLRNVGLAMYSLRDVPNQPTRDDDDPLRRLETVNQGLRQMATLVHRWMAQPSDPNTVHYQNRTLGEVIEDTVKLTRPAAQARKAELCLCVADEAARLPAGPLAPVVSNALRNAIEAIDPQIGGRVELIAMVENGLLELRVRDDGAGVSPALFDKQGHFQPGTTSKPNGHGLGLVLVREIALSLGGTLELGNRPPHGAALTFRCPLVALAAAR